MNLERISRGIGGTTVELSFDSGSKDSERLAALLQEIANDMKSEAVAAQTKATVAR